VWPWGHQIRPAGRGSSLQGEPRPHTFSANPERIIATPPNKPDERERSHVRQLNLQGGDRSVRGGWRYRIARYLLLERDGRVTVSAVCASTNLLCDVHSGVLLVDGVRAGEQAIGRR
jgi:hypothetical protein